ncbi:MAG: hypothetical protein WEE89_21495 [Gemmatimonadota bacterium]
MAQIQVEKKRSTPVWLWVVLALVIIAAVLYYLATSGTINIPGVSPETTLNQGVIEWQRSGIVRVTTWLA